MKAKVISDNRFGDFQYTKDAIKSIIGKTINVYDKNEIGASMIGNATVLEDGNVEMKIDNKEIIDLIKKGDLYAVPGGTIQKSHMENGVHVLEEITITHLTLTSKPLDKSLTPLKLSLDNAE